MYFGHSHDGENFIAHLETFQNPLHNNSLSPTFGFKMAEPATAPAPAPESGSASANWRDSSNWRTREAGSAPSTRAPRFNTGRYANPGNSWRDREKRNTENTESPDGSGARPVEASDFVPKSRPYDRTRTNRPAQRDDEGAAKAIEEGRRIYIGNLRYSAKPEDIETLLKANDLGHFNNIHISIDPFTGRNPSYCFVEFPDADSATKAMEILEGKDLLGREVKCRPCQPKGSGSGGKPTDAPTRWGQWEKADSDGQGRQNPPSFDRYRQDFTVKRLYVGGLPRMHDQSTNFAEITELFKDFKLEAISKRVSAHESVREKPGNHDFCFVDFATAEDAKTASETMNGRMFRGGPLKVNTAKGRSNKWQERDDLNTKPHINQDWSEAS
ncbi:hypothetical protein GGR57DRAFT_463538 [Xylariaceae sp. FL1272]|nr:hypothetical protein GGR57DRAFT_463538 [Xylariaceae sp. FL1272]